MFYRTLPLAGTFMLCLGSAAYAHARLETSDPKNGVTLHTPPPSLTLTFSEGLERAFSRVSLTDATGSNIELKTMVVGGDGDNLLSAVPATRLLPGSYKPEWHVLSKDGHQTSGALTFQVVP